ncbi:hypothetical protein [Mesorhizobium sp. INR15]|uniref:hypothetical protein n=1 Tax=Mesorhizobium sp. INR15 TaxID=2654248 RepID=UPI0018969864|nr:hypothetical protein [Mesorhizobium sp. INR15]QPC94475.1 hypothetical protein GA829_29915 [Mesorhizobium sp. INR15]
MALITRYSSDLGIRRLLAQPRDVAPPKDIRVARKHDEASPMHRTLFIEYVAELTDAYDIAAEWWADIISAEEELQGSREKALAKAFDDRVAGAAASPNLVWVIRRYWLKCVTVNVTAGEEAGVAAEIFLLQWLIDAGQTELVKLVACMPYWPIGQDEKGNWC